MAVFTTLLLQMWLAMAASPTKQCATGGNVMLQLGGKTSVSRSTGAVPSQVLPDRSYCVWSKYASECFYFCPVGFSLKIEEVPREGECSSVMGPEWVIKKRFFRNPAINDCVTCERDPSVELPESVTPQVGYCPGDCTLLSCPRNYMLSDKEEICVVQPEKDFGSTQIFLPNDGVSLADCATLGPKYVAKQSTPNGCAPHPCYRDCATFNSSFTSYVCQTCVPSPISSTTTLPSTTSATTTWSTTASSMPSREWEEFAGPFNRVCRGLGPTDNNPAYFTVHFEVASVEACKDLCLEQGEEGCKGVEYNSISKRCEVWTRREGIWAFDYPQWEGFTCLRYGWPGKYLIPVNGGLDQACRGPDGKNSDSYYVVERFVSHMEDCRARCVAAKICKGVEFSKGRCEIWTTDIVTTKAIAGFECLRYQPPV